MSQPPLSDLRKSYELGQLEDHEVRDDPFVHFEEWFAEAMEKACPSPTP